MFGFWSNEKRSITVTFDGTPGQVGERTLEKGKWRYAINLGHPIIHRKIQEFDSNQDDVYEVLRQWIALDAANIAQKHAGRSVAVSFKNWQTNESPSKATSECRFYMGQGGSTVIETALKPVLMALALNYRNDNMQEKDSALRGFMDKIGIKAEDLKFIDAGGESHKKGNA